MPEKFIGLRNFLDAVHNKSQGTDKTVEDTVASILDDAVAREWNGVALNTSANGETEEQIFNALVSRENIKSLVIMPNVELESIEDCLRQAIRELQNLQKFLFATLLTETEGARIFSILQTSSTLNQISIYMGDCGDEIAKPLGRFLRETSSLKSINMTWGSLSSVTRRGSSLLSQTAMSCILDGIGECNSLEAFHLCLPPADDGDANIAAESLAQAVVSSTRLNKVVVYVRELPNFPDKVHNALIQTDAVKNLELCFHSLQEAGDDNRVFVMDRNAPWKPLLAQDIPLALWPRILAKTKTWNQHVSHSSLDALFFLTKEKCDVLLQNVRRRKIRKRKRFQFSA